MIGIMSIYINPKYRGIKGDFKNSTEKPIQQMSFDRLMETRDEAREKMAAFLHDLSKQVGFVDTIVDHDGKSLNRIYQKAREDYGGNPRYVNDPERCKGVGDNPFQILKAKSEVTNPNSEIMLKHGAELVYMNDQFDEPKKETGYRCINCKISFPVGDQQERHTVEVQIVAKQIEEVYEKTHEYLETSRDVAEKARERELTPEETRIISYCAAGCRYENGIASRENGYDELLDQRKRSVYELSHTRQNNMEHQILALQNLMQNYEAE